jgi:flagellar hook-basal body complex protein FliE
MNDFLIQQRTGKSAYPVDNGGGKKKIGGGFSDYVRQAVKSVNDMEVKADRSVEQMTKGETGVHETMIALQKADISLRLLLQVRNKALEAYREIMRMAF